MWVLLAGLAFAQGVDDETRLLGPEPAAAVVATAAPRPSFDMPPWWTVPLVGLGLAAAWNQRKRRADVDAEAMRVLGRTALGKDSAVVMLEVRDADGGWRRLLLGSSPQGTQLLTELGGIGSFATEMDRAAVLPEVPARRVVEPAPVQPTPPAHSAPAPTIGPARARAAALHGELASLPGVLREPPPVRAPTQSLQEGMDLLAEVRRTKGRLGTRVQAYG